MLSVVEDEVLCLPVEASISPPDSDSSQSEDDGPTAAPPVPEVPATKLDNSSIEEPPFTAISTSMTTNLIKKTGSQHYTFLNIGNSWGIDQRA